MNHEENDKRAIDALEKFAKAAELFAIAFDRGVTLLEGVVNDARVWLKEKEERDRGQPFRR